MSRTKKDKSFANLAKRIALSDYLSNQLLRTREETREAAEYNQNLKNYAQFIGDIAAKGTLADKIEAEIALQERDLLHAENTGNPVHIKEAEAARIDFRAGLVVYDRLAGNPQQYREYAEGFMQKNRFSGGVPKDEFHNVLKSQNSREAMRDGSRHNTAGEEALVKARKILLAAILEDYTRAQEIVIGGGEPPKGTARIGLTKV